MVVPLHVSPTQKPADLGCNVGLAHNLMQKREFFTRLASTMRAQTARSALMTCYVHHSIHRLRTLTGVSARRCRSTGNPARILRLRNFGVVKSLTVPSKNEIVPRLQDSMSY